MTGRDRLLAGLTRSQRAALLQRLPQPRPEFAAIPATGVGRAPLSFAQQRLWFIDRMQGPDPTYVMPLGLAIRGTIDIAALARALHLLAARHDALRLRIIEETDGPYLEAVPPEALEGPRLELVDLSARAPEEAQAEAAELSAEDARRPFDLGTAPLLRATLICLKPDHHHLLLTFHHIISDGWSNGIALRDLVALYVAARDGRVADLPAITHGYLDYAHWQRDPSRSAVIERQTAAWQRRLEGAPAGLDLATDCPRPAALSYRGAVAPFVVDEALTAGLNACCRAQGASLFMGLLGIYAVLLCRHGAGSDLVIGSPIANRLRPELEPVLGFFANTLALRVDLDGDPSFNALLARIRRFMLDAYSDQEAPFEQLVDRLAAVRALDRTPLFEALLVFQQAGQGAPPAGLGLEVTPLERTTGRVHFPLALGISEVDGRLEARLGYQTDLFALATAERLARHFLQLVAAVIATPEVPVSQLAMLSEEELAVLARLGTTAPGPIHGMHTSRFGMTRPPLAPPFSPRGRRAAGRPDGGGPQARSQRPPLIRAAARPSPARGEGLAARPRLGQRTRSVHAISDLADLVDVVARHSPAATAVEAADGRLSYAELAERSGRLAQALLADGLAPGEPIGLCAERGLMLTVAILAILKAGCPVMPLDPALPPARLAVLIAEGRPQRILAQARFRAALPAEAPVMPIEEVAQAATEHQQIPLPASPDGLAYVLFTSGSTGVPKGVAMGRRAFGNLIAWQQCDSVLGRAQRTAQFAALGFDVSFQEMFGCWATGGTLVLIDEETRRDPAVLWRWLAASRIERLYLPVVALQHLAEAAALAPEPGAGARVPLADVIVAGESLVITPKIRAFFARHRCRLHNHYGPTETHVVTVEMLDGDANTWPERPAIGKPLPGCVVRVAGPGGETVPLGVTGELRLGGAQLAEGYLGRPNLTAERFVSDAEGRRFYRTGDRVRQRPDGTLDYLGRLDDQVKIRGFRVEPGEIAAVLSRHPAVAEAAVIAIDAADGERALAAYVAPAAGATGGVSALVLKDYLVALLPAHCVPASFTLVARLPVSANGKLDRRALPPPAPARADAPAVAPAGETEQRVAAIFATVLAVPDVDAEADFFALGGHSLLAVRLAMRIRESFGIDLPLRAIFEAPRLRDLATRIDRLRPAAAARPALRPADRTRPLPLSFAQERLYFLDELTGATGAYNMSAGLRLLGPLDIDALTRAVTAVVARHEVLRSRIVLQDGTPVQIIDPPRPVTIPVADLTALDPPARSDAIAEAARQITAARFDLTTGPLLQLRLLRLAAAEHLLLAAFHHIVMDAWSIAILLRELAAFYAHHDADDDAVPPLRAQYGDYAVWQRDLMDAAWGQAEAAWWRAQLAGAPDRMRLPVDRPRPPKRSGRGDAVPLALLPATASGLAATGENLKATPFMLLLAGLAAFLVRLTGERDLVIGTPTANRTAPEIEDSIGFFVNLLALRLRPGDGASLHSLAADARDTALAAFAHGELPFERVVELVNPGRGGDGSPLVNVVLALREAGAGLDLPGLTIEPFPLGAVPVKYDLIFTLEPRDGGYAGAIEFDADLFERATVEAMAAGFAGLLAAAAAQPQMPILDLPLGSHRPVQEPTQELGGDAAQFDF
jgi:amino acid adenylation domain-containing protein